MPRLLVLGAAGMRGDAFAGWARSGLEVLLADASPHGPYDARVTRARRAQTWGETDPLATVPDWVAIADGVTTLSDFSVVAAARAAEERGLPGPGLAAARRTRDKVAQRNAFAAAGLAGPRFAPIRDEADVRRFYASDPGPCVLKPADSAGSAGVLVVRSADEAVAALPAAAKWSFSGTCILEQRLVGTEYSVEGWARDGEVTVLTTTVKRVAPGSFVEVQHLVPAQANAGIEGVVARAVEALGLRTSTFHAEVMDTATVPVMIEVAARPGGGMIPSVVQAATGVDLYGVQAALALGTDLPARSRPAGRYAGVRFAVCRGEVREVADLTPLSAAAGVLAAEQVLPVGTRESDLVGNDLRAGYVIAAGDDRDDLETRLTRHAEELSRRMGCG